MRIGAIIAAGNHSRRIGNGGTAQVAYASVADKARSIIHTVVCAIQRQASQTTHNYAQNLERKQKHIEYTNLVGCFAMPRSCTSCLGPKNLNWAIVDCAMLVAAAKK